MAKSLKAANLKWLWSAVAVDAAVCVIVASPSLLETGQPSHLFKSAIVPAAPVIVLLLSQLLSSEAKARLVFWRLNHAYPGHRAFTVVGPRDSRFAMVDLEKNIGSLPQDPGEQNTTWFKLYKKVESDVTVSEAHGHYLLLRDLAAMSFLLVPLGLAAGVVANLSVGQTAIIAGVFAAQYILAAVAARNSGERMVANVLVLHALKKRR